MADRHAECASRVARAVLDAPGATDLALRLAVQHRTTSADPSSALESHSLPPRVAAYVDKVSRHAYRVTDEDVAALKAEGHSEDAIFEITVAAAVAAGLDRLKRGLALLDEERS
jgi:alkylhydroperoxidase family enzyme